MVSDLIDNEIYYWSIIPTARGLSGKCTPLIGEFAVDKRNTKPITNLILPLNEMVVPKSPVLYWDYSDPDPFETLYFDIYFDENEELVTKLDPQALIATIKDNTHYYLSDFQSGKTYYWTVISNDKAGAGICTCGVWEFTINDLAKNYPPVVWLDNPKDSSTMNKDTFQLTWKGKDDDNDLVNYSVYFSDDYESVYNLDKSALIIITKANEVSISNLSDGKTYYWTIVPNDGKVYGVCLDEIRSFKYESKSDSNDGFSAGSNQFYIISLLITVTLVIMFLLSLYLWVIRKRKKGRSILQLITNGSGSTISSDTKSGLISHGTYKVLHKNNTNIGDLNSSELAQKGIHGRLRYGSKSTKNVPGVKRGKRKSVRVVGKIDKQDILKKIKDESNKPKIDELLEKHTIKYIDSNKPKPYLDGDYDYTIEKSRYKPLAGMKAEQVKKAIPYAKGSQKDDHILTKKEIKHAKPMNKKISSEKAIKASSLPITRQCPKCGSFKVKTFKDDTNKCLDCKNRF
jgi:hypothetical protein